MQEYPRVQLVEAEQGAKHEPGIGSTRSRVTARHDSGPEEQAGSWRFSALRRCHHEPGLGATGEVRKEKLVWRATLDGPRRERTERPLRELRRLGVGGRAGDQQPQDQPLELEHRGRVEGLDELGMRDGPGYFSDVAVRVGARPGVPAQERASWQRAGADPRHGLTASTDCQIVPDEADISAT